MGSESGVPAATFVSVTSQTLSHVRHCCYNYHDMDIPLYENPSRRAIARRVVAARKMAEMTQVQLARRLSDTTGHQWSRDVIASLETGRRMIPAEVLVSLGEVLDVAPGWFLSDPRGFRPTPGSRRTPGQRPPVFAPA